MIISIGAMVIVGGVASVFMINHLSQQAPIAVEQNGVKLQITAPKRQQVADQTLDVALTVNDKDKKVSKVEYVVDGQVQASATRSPFTSILRTAHLNEGKHVLVIRAIAKDGRTIVSQTIEFTVKHSPAATSQSSDKTKAAPSTGSSSGKASPKTSVGQSPSATASSPATISSIFATIPLVPWEGGSNYWKQFPKANAAGWGNPSFFPIAVFLGKPGHASALKAVGVNTYMGAEHDGSAMSSMTSAGMFVMPQQDEWTPAEVGNDSRAVGWFISDECDIGLGCTGNNTNENLLDQQSKLAYVHGLNDGRFTFANYSNGILKTWWANGNMPAFLSIVDAASNDKYTYTSPFVWDQMTASPDWPAGVHPAVSAAYGWQIDQMRSFQSPPGIHPNWIFIEAAMPLLNDPGSLTITPQQLEGAVWSSIIHEARGVAYFQHNNGNVCGYYSLVDCNQTRLNQIAAINAKVTSLAPVINTQSYQYSFNTTTDTMLKAYNGAAYIFAGIGLGQSTGAKTFTLPSGLTASSVEVVGENRTLPISGGKFTDTFAAEYSYHVYKIIPQ